MLYYSNVPKRIIEWKTALRQILLFTFDLLRTETIKKRKKKIVFQMSSLLANVLC